VQYRSRGRHAAVESGKDSSQGIRPTDVPGDDDEEHFAAVAGGHSPYRDTRKNLSKHKRRRRANTCARDLGRGDSALRDDNTDLRQLGLYYREYRRLMDHWRRVLPLPMLEIDYQQMIDSQEAESRRLIDFLGLPWNDACLNFHETERTVQTISRWQVRQPIYKTSVNRWKDYEKHLGPLKEALGDLAKG